MLKKYKQSVHCHIKNSQSVVIHLVPYYFSGDGHG